MQRALDIALERARASAHAVAYRRLLRRDLHQCAQLRRAVSWCSTPFEEARPDPRESAAAIQAQLNRRLSVIQDAFIIAVLPPPVRGIGTAGGFRMMVEDRAGHGSAALAGNATESLVLRAVQDARHRAGVLAVRTPRRRRSIVDIDRIKAQLLGVNVPDVFNALQVYLGSSYVNDFNLFGRTFRVMAQARDEDRQHIADVLNIRVRNSSGDMVPLGSFATVRDIAGPYRVPRYNLYPAAEIDGAAAPGYSHGQAIAIMEKLAARRCRRASPPSGRRSPSSRSARRQYRDLRLRAGGGVRLPGAGGAVRKPDAAARGHPDRADVSRRRDHRRHPARPRQQHPHSDRLRGADRPGGEERDPDRRVRPPAGGARDARAGTPPSRRRGCGCGRS